jgi:hypothetical protein
MAEQEQGKIPIPKSQLEISNNYVQSRQTYGVPNEFVPTRATADNRTNDQVVNPARASQISLKDDSWKPFTIGLKDIDETIKYYFDNVIKPYVSQNGARVAVPVIYGSPERWKSVQHDGYYKDVNGRIMAPLIMYKRTSIDRNRGMTSKVDSNFPQTYAVFQQKYTKQNFYNQLSVLNGATPIKTYQAVVIPDFVTLNYSCMIYTYYMEQLNKIVEAINYAADSYWGDPQRFKFKANIGSYQTITELNVGQQRTVRGSFEIKLNGYIIPDVIQKDLNAVKKFSSDSTINISSENIENLGRSTSNNFIEDINTNL